MPRTARKRRPTYLQVIVTVSGGVADLLFKPVGVAVDLFDYDVDGAAPDEPGMSRDPAGQICSIRRWETGQEIAGSENWPIVKKVRQGSYYRTWKCPGCGRGVEHSYEALAEVGMPICAECDRQMELL